MSAPDPAFLSRAGFVKLIQDLRASYWFIPVVMVCAAVVLAQTVLWLDRTDSFASVGLPRVLQDTQVEGARGTVSVIAQSVIGVAGVMFSMTVVAVSFAAGNFGPRLIGNLMRDTRNQISLGTLIAIYVYCLLVLRAIQSPQLEGGSGFVPHYAVLLSLVLALVAVVTILLFVHHIPETINVSNITAGLGERFCAAIEVEIARPDPQDAGIAWPDDTDQTTIYLTRRGYIQAVDIVALRDMAQGNDWFITVHLGAGRFVTPQRKVMDIIAQTPLEPEQVTELQSAFAIGKSRREAQNLDFLIDQQIEVIARALSPGVNDPFTAINCLNWLTSGLSTALVHDGGLPLRKRGRVAMPDVSFQSLFERAYGHCLPYLCDDDLCRKHADDLLNGLASIANDNDRDVIRQMQSRLAKGAPSEV